MTRRRAFIMLLTLGVLLVISATDYRGPYRDGLTAFENKHYSSAEHHFRKAIAARISEALHAIESGSFNEPYLPHFYLGAALAHQGKCRDARMALEESRRQGVLGQVLEQSRRHRNLYRQAQADCPEEPTLETPSPTLTSTAAATTSVIDSVAPSTAPLPAPQAVDTRSQTATSADAPPPPPSMPAASSVGELRAVTPVTDAAPAAVGAAFDRLIRGDYGAAITVLEGINDTRPQVRAQVFLLRSAARFSLYEIEGRANPTLRSDAVADAISARSLLPNGHITMPEAFSPKFRRFFSAAPAD